MIFLKAKDLKNRILYNNNEISKKVKKFLFINLMNNSNYSKKLPVSKLLWFPSFKIITILFFNY